jgi:hemolysin III
MHFQTLKRRDFITRGCNPLLSGGTTRDSIVSCKRCPGEIAWHYGRNELIADGVIHAIGIVLGLIGAIAITIFALNTRRIEITPIFIYAVCLMAMLVLSALYNLWPISPTKWLLRRFDHSAVYLLIAGTYTPFLAMMKNGVASMSLGVGIWSSAVLGMALKLVLPGRFDRAATVFCLILGWSGIIAYDSLASAVPATSLWLLGLGGVLYSIGTLFFAWRGLRFQNVIWHGFVLLAAGSHYSAVVACLAAP